MRRNKQSAPFSLFAFQDAITSVCGVVVLITLTLALELTKRVVDDLPTETAPTRSSETIRAEIDAARAEIESLERSRRLAESFDARQVGATREEAERAFAETAERLAETESENERLKGLIAETKERNGERSFELAARNESLDAEKRRVDAELAEIEKKTERLANSNGVFFAFSRSTREKPWFVDVSETRIRTFGIGSDGAESNGGRNFDGAKRIENFLAWAKTRDAASEYFVLVYRPSGAGDYDATRNPLEEAGFRVGVDLIGETSEIQTIETDK